MSLGLRIRISGLLGFRITRHKSIASQSRSFLNVLYYVFGLTTFQIQISFVPHSASMITNPKADGSVGAYFRITSHLTKKSGSRQTEVLQCLLLARCPKGVVPRPQAG